MDEIGAKILTRLYPDAFAAEDAGWQQRRSAETRVALLEATIESLVKLGYARTSTQTIADFAGITRGAMGHHYATRLDLISAVTDYTFYKRMEIYLHEIEMLTLEDRRRPAVAMDLYVQNSRRREFQAYVELLVASRTDEELRVVFLPKARRFRQIWHSEMERVFPGWEGKEPLIRLCSDFATLINEALLINSQLIDSPADQQAIEALTAAMIRMVRDGEIEVAGRSEPL
jgi:AcrR family transcriptional regulator